MRYVDREGLEALTMRKLGAELGVEAMSLYNHVPNKSALLDGMVEVLLGELEIPPENRSWEERIREGYRAFRRLALVEEVLKTLEEAGFGKETALHAFRALSSYTFGYAMSEIRGFALEPGGSRLGALRLSPEEFPRISELGPRLEGVDHDAEFEFGLDFILDGLKKHKSA